MHPEHPPEALQAEQPTGQVAQVFEGMSAKVPAGQLAAVTQVELA